MLAGSLLLTATNGYVKSDGSLPDRPAHDKAFLKDCLTNELVSEAGYALLPASHKAVCSIGKPSFAVTIEELSKADVLFIIRSPKDFTDGKYFRLDKFRCLMANERIEIWILK